MDATMGTVHVAVKKVNPRKLPVRQPRSSARNSLGGPITQYILQLHDDEPNMPYAELADKVREKYGHARTSEKSVASTIYRAQL